MKETILDHIMRGIVFGGLALFGLRGMLPDIVAEGEMPAFLASVAAVILGYAIGASAYRCEPTCDPQVCRVQ